MCKNVLIVSFSGRKNGNCNQISDFIQKSVPDAEIFRFSENPIRPCGECAYECFEDNRMCPHIDDGEYGLLERICLSDLVYFVVPNYCDYPCANFFIFNERSQVYFQSYRERLLAYEAVPKKFIVVSNSDSPNFAAAFDYHCAAEPEILYLSAKKYGQNSIDGDLLTAIEVRAAINRFVEPEDLELD